MKRYEARLRHHENEGIKGEVCEFEIGTMTVAVSWPGVYTAIELLPSIAAFEHKYPQLALHSDD